MNDTREICAPIFVFPNNQQEIPSTEFRSFPYRIVSLTTWGSLGIGVVLDVARVLLIPASPPGYYSVLEMKNQIGIYKSEPCVPGTHKTHSHFGPCIICPPGYKNNGSFGDSCVECTTNDTFWCFGAAINEINMTNVNSYDQASPYPESPHTTEFEDILLQSIFLLQATSLNCLMTSPIFWTLITFSCCVILYILIKLLSCCCKSEKPQRFVENLFSHCDFIGVGKYWLGGLVSLSVLSLIVFACKFSISFGYLYPIEESSLEERLQVSCDHELFNAKLTSSLQLLSMLKHNEEKPVFNLLDEQPITLTVQFINTGYTCKDTALHLLQDRGLNIVSKNFNCSKMNEILTISKVLLAQVIPMQINLNGPHFIGGLRLCFSAPPVADLAARSKVQKMDTCQLFFMPNQTLTRNPTVNVKMTKIINRTAGFTSSNETTYTGLWLPHIVVDTITDELLFSRGSEYLRYVPQKSTLIVVITESEYYMQNTQEPIARRFEILFSTVLFASKTKIEK